MTECCKEQVFTFGGSLDYFGKHSVAILVGPNHLELVHRVGLEIEDLTEPGIGWVDWDLDPVGVRRR